MKKLILCLIIILAIAGCSSVKVILVPVNVRDISDIKGLVEEVKKI